MYNDFFRDLDKELSVTLVLKPNYSTVSNSDVVIKICWETLMTLMKKIMPARRRQTTNPFEIHFNRQHFDPSWSFVKTFVPETQMTHTLYILYHRHL